MVGAKFVFNKVLAGGGAAGEVDVGADSAVTVGADKGAESFPSAVAGADSEATRALTSGEADAVVEGAFVEDAFALGIEAGAAESEVGAGVNAGEETPRPSAAKAGDPKSANSMAEMATLTSLPLT
ncbi:MAG TPA: hypothetical protein VFQ41_06620 [Candidatus Angelobacter sp.]|nr:hypothetical protein [Candidatus Angelobacter sp.]